MVGSHTIISQEIKNTKAKDLSFLKHEQWFKADSIFDDNHITLALSHYTGYPFEKWENENYIILLEGMIYNFSEQEVEKKLKELVNSFCVKQDYKTLINEFVENADGDFIVQIYDKNNRRYILFNDYLGRLSLYYYISNNQILISREIKFILEFISEISFNKAGIAENLMLGYTLGDKTIFNNVLRLYPCEYIFCDFNNGNKYSKGNTAEFNFNFQNRFYNKKKSLQKLKYQFLEATKNRINKLHEKGFKPISDLSGGYDSRVLIGGLCKFDKNVDYYTCEYIQDESVVAGRLFKKLNVPGKHIKTSFKNEVDIESISGIVYKTDGLVNYYTTGICYNDATYIKLLQKRKVGHFSALGGERLRHPFKNFYKSIPESIFFELYGSIDYSTVFSLLNSNNKLILEYKQNLINNYLNLKKEEQLKKFYFDYYYNSSTTGSERGSIFFWNIDPLWSKDFVKTIFHQIPLKWTGYRYFIEFMRLIDSRLLEAPIYKSDVDLQSKNSINKIEKEYKKQFSKKICLYNYMKDKVPVIISVYKNMKKKNDKKDATNNKEILTLFYKYFNKLNKCDKLFNLNAIEKTIHKTGGEYNRLITLAMYLYEIEKRYSNKIKIDE